MNLADEVLASHQSDCECRPSCHDAECLICMFPWPCAAVRLALALRAAEKVVEAARQRLQECLCGDSYPEMCPSCQPLAAALAEYDKGGQG